MGQSFFKTKIFPKRYYLRLFLTPKKKFVAQTMSWKKK
jgi:hypothetical protein